MADKEKKVTILIEHDQLNPDEKYMTVVYNLKTYKLERGKYVEVQKAVADIIKESNEIIHEIDVKNTEILKEYKE
jgi:hypothetical protein